MEYFNGLKNPEKYLDYLIATQNGWHLLGYLTTREQYIKAFKALEHKEIITLRIGGIEEDRVYNSTSLIDSDIFILARSLASKTSLKKIKLYRKLRYTELSTGRTKQTYSDFPSNNAEYGMCALFESLSSCPLVNLNLTRFEMTPMIFESFLNMLKLCTSIQGLELLNMQLNDAMVERIIDALGNNEELTSLDLTYHANITVASAFKIADFLKHRKKKFHLKFPEPLNVDESKEFFARLGDSTSLISFYHFDEAFTEGTQILDRNRQIWQEKRNTAKIEAEKLEKARVIQPAQDDSIFKVNDDSNICSLIIMPDDIMKTILYQLDIKSVLQFRMVDKYFNGMIRKSKFWRDYYLRYFNVIPKDVLEISDYVYGLQLLDNKTTTSIPSFWELIFRHSMLLRPISAQNFPCKLSYEGTFIVNAVYRNFPQLIGTTEGSLELFENLPPKQIFEAKKSPYSQYWFMIYSIGQAMYHLGFEQDGDNLFNAILLVTEDFSAGWDRRFEYLKYVLEWTTADSEKEFEEKIKPVVEVFLNARLTFMKKSTCKVERKNIPLFKKILADVIKGRKELVESLNSKLNTVAKRHCSDLDIDFKNVQQFCQKIENLKNKIESKKIHSSEFTRLKQQIAPRSDLFDKYRSQFGPFVFSFQVHNFIPHSAQKSLIIPSNTNTNKKKRSKIQGNAALTSFYRMMINFIVMPIVELLWMDSRSDPDFLHEPHFQTQELLPLYIKLFRDVTLTRFSDVSVRHAHPKNWPITALAVADRIVEPLTSVLQAVISDDSSKSQIQPDLIQQFHQLLCSFGDLLPQNHINATIQLIESFKNYKI